MAKKKTSGTMIYVGPGFRDMDLQTYGIFAEGMPEKYRDTIYATLFVTPQELNSARKEIAIKGTMLNVCYQKAVEAHKKISKGRN